MPPRLNSKAVAGRERKKEQEDKKKAEDARHKQEAEDKEWQKGANIKGQSRDESAATRADEAARKKREKMELVKAEEAELMGTVVKKTPTQQKKGGKKKKNDVSLLLLQGEADALVKNADKKLKAEKKLAAAKEQETTRRLLDEQKKQAELIPMDDPLLQNTESMLQVPAGRSINKQSMEEGAASGLDAALASMGMNSYKSTQLTYKEFEERMLPIVKEDYPGLRLTQYKEKVFQMWKKSPENPSNQIP